MPGIVKSQIKILVWRLLTQAQVVHTAHSRQAGACGLQVCLGTTGQRQGTQLRHVALDAIADVVGRHKASAGRDSEQTVPKRLAQSILDQQSLVFARWGFESFAHGADIQCQGFITHQSADLGPDLADVFPHHAASQRDIKTPARLTLGLHRDFDVVGTEPLLQQRFELHRLTELIIRQLKTQVFTTGQRQANDGTDRLVGVDQHQGLALRLRSANLEHRDEL